MGGYIPIMDTICMVILPFATLSPSPVVSHASHAAAGLLSAQSSQDLPCITLFSPLHQTGLDANVIYGLAPSGQSAGANAVRAYASQQAGSDEKAIYILR